MSSVFDTRAAEAPSFADAEEASENVCEQVERARQALSDYHATYPIIAPEEEPEELETSRERAANAADQPDLHPKA